MKSSVKLSQAAVIVCIAGSLITNGSRGAFGQYDRIKAEALRDVVIGIKADQPAAWLNREIKFGVQSVTVKPGQSAKTLLKDRGIEPDASALGVLYSLNPQLNQIGSVRPGSRLMLPEVRINQPTPEAGGLAAFLRLERQTSRFRDQIDALQATVLEFNKLPGAKFEAEAIQQRLADNLTDSCAKLTALRGDRNPVPPALVEQVTSEIEIVAAALSQAAASEEKIGRREIEFASKMDRHWQVSAREVEEGFRGTRIVSVETVAAIGNQKSPQNNFSVYFVADGIYDLYQNEPDELIRKAHTFNKPSSPTDCREIMSGDYRFWAVFEELCSDYEKKDIRSVPGGSLTIELRVPESR